MDDTKKITKFFASEVKSVDDKEFTVTAVVSTKKEDRDGDVILPEAFKGRMKHYKDHPVFLANHRYDVQSIIGEAKTVKITDAGLEATFKYYVGQGNPTADWAFNLAKNGIAAFSVGFIGHGWEPIVDKENNYVTGRTFTDVELIEISQVAVPSNRGALQMSRQAAIAELEVLEAVAKGFQEGKIAEVVVEPKKQVQSEKAKADEPESGHYSETILGAGEKSSKLTPDEIVNAIRQGFLI